MGRLAIVSATVLLAATACGSATSLRSATPLPNVLVYAKPTISSNVAFDVREAIWRARLDGSRAKRVASGNDPAVSPDGRWIAFGRGAGLFVMPAAGGAAAQVYTFTGRIAALSGAATWAPNSRFLVFEGAYGPPVVLDPFSRRTHALPEGASATGFAFSPDSRKIVYSVHEDIYVVPAFGGTPGRLTYDHKSFAPVWGKAGIAFVRFAPRRQGELLLGDIWLTDGTKDHVRQLTHTGVAAWPEFFSADGKELLAANPAMHNGRLWAVNVTTGAERPLTPWVGDLFAQGLSADGKTVLAAIGCGGLGTPYGKIETIPFAGGKLHTIARGPCRASWNAR